jgi:RNA polymerase sigma-70 factor (ECF subfamily)
MNSCLRLAPASDAHPCQSTSFCRHLTLIEGGLATGAPAQSFREQLRDVVPDLQRQALRLCRDTHRAQDLVQDSLERALRFESTFTPNSNMKAWAKQVLYSVFVSQCRRNGRERKALARFACEPDTQATPRGDVSPVLLPSLERALRGLPTPFGQTLLLIDLQELSYKQAAVHLGVPVGTVMSRLHRARRLLGEQIKQCAA